MIGENSYRPDVAADPSEKMAEEFENFVEANKFSADQVREAYQQFCGISENKEKDPSVEKISVKMEEMSADGFPLNRFAEMINAKTAHEDAVPRYCQFIEGLNFSDKEKKVLRSIVENKRAGKMEFSVDGETVTEFGIKKSDAEVEALAEEMMGVIQEIIERLPKGKKVDFIFSED